MREGSWIVLTGATGGIGSAVARCLSDQGANLILVARNQQKLQQLQQQLGKQHLILAVDLSTVEGRAALHNSCAQHPHGIDILINNAGISEFALLQQMTADRISELLHVNLISAIDTCRLLLPLLLKRANGQIINVGSTFGSIGHPGFSVYCASKFGLKGFSEALRRELLDTDVKVSYFAPRATKTTINTDSVTNMNAELGNAMDEPEQVASALAKLIHDGKAAHYFLGWPEKLFVRVNALIPSLVDKALLKQLPVIKRYLL